MYWVSLILSSAKGSDILDKDYEKRLNGEARGIKRQIAQWQNELQETKFVNSDKIYITENN